MNQKIIKRITAFLIDYGILVLYATALFAIVLAFNQGEDGIPVQSPLRGQFIGFLTLTLPVFFYFVLFEKYGRKATPGKRITKLEVTAVNDNSGNVFIRNLLKFLPWEIAHTGVHWLIFYGSEGREIPFWVWSLLILPQLIVAAYLVSIFASRGESSLYDKIAGTKVIMSQ